jgi:hypothetical protein
MNVYDIYNELVDGVYNQTFTSLGALQYGGHMDT